LVRYASEDRKGEFAGRIKAKSKPKRSFKVMGGYWFLAALGALSIQVEIKPLPKPPYSPGAGTPMRPNAKDLPVVVERF
jgi:hypothetical protein